MTTPLNQEAKMQIIHQMKIIEQAIENDQVAGLAILTVGVDGANGLQLFSFTDNATAVSIMGNMQLVCASISNAVFRSQQEMAAQQAQQAQAQQRELLAQQKLPVDVEILPPEV